MDKNDEDNVDDETEEPNINVLEVRSLRKRRVDWREQGCKNKQACERSHEAVGEISNVDVEGEISNNPEDKRLKESCRENLDVKSFNFKGIYESGLMLC